MTDPPALPHPYLVIRASAGTGKTYALSSRYIGLLERDVPVDEILATTFTKKAAGEILERILVRLAKAVGDESLRQELAESIHTSSLSRERCRELLTRLVRNLHRLRVGTLDSFFGQLATTHSLDLELPPGWQIADEHAVAGLQDAAVAALLANNPEGDVTRLMHLVGKGDGGRQVADLIRSTVRNLHEKFQGSQESAWQQISRGTPLPPLELAQLLEELADTPLPSHKRAADAHAKALALAQEENWQAVIGAGLAAKVLEGETNYQRKDIPPETVELYRQLIDHARAVLLTQLANQNEGTHDLLRKFDHEYERLKSELRVLGFADVKHQLCSRVLLEDGERWAFRMDSRIAHLLLDEFQDTAADQWQVIEPIARRIMGGENSSFFCVGDTKQAIYGWRGGEARIFFALEPRLGQLRLESLARSHRSSQVIIDATNAIFPNLPNHNNLGDYQPAVRAWCEMFDIHETVWPLRRGHATLETAPPAADAEKQAEVTLAYAADKIAQLASSVPDRTIGVLVRTNDAVSRLIYELRRRGISASEEGDTAITDSAAVQLILSLVEWVDHPGNTVARFHVATSPLAAAINFPNYASRTAQAAFAARLRAQLATAGYGPTVGQWAELLVPHSSTREAHRLRQLVQLAYDFQPRATLRPSEFVEFVRRRRVAAPEAVRVRVMTIHQAKGLEFDVVVLPQLDDRLIGQPNAVAIGREQIVGPIHTVCLHRDQQLRKLLPRRIQQLFDEDIAQQIAEALSRLYVSITRAAYALHMVIAPSLPNERNLPKTPAGLLRAALVGTNRVEESATLWEFGDANWFEHERDGRVLIGEAAPIEVPTPETSPLVRVRERSRCARTWATPSQLEGGGQPRPAAAFRAERHVAMRRGSLLHALFEQIEWLDAGPPDDAALRGVAAAYGVDGDDLETLLDEFRTITASPPIAAILTRATYEPPRDLPLPAGSLELKVRREQRIVSRTAEHFLSGSIDRLVLIHHDGQLLAADVIDFKTDLLPADDAKALAARVDVYRPQIEAYRAAVAQMFRLPAERVAGRLLFTAIGKIVDA